MVRREIGRLLCRDRAVSAKIAGSMNERARRFAQICKDVRERAGDRRTDADPEQQGDDAEKHSDEDVGWGPHVSESIPNLRLCLARPAVGRQAAHQRRGAADCGEHRQAAGISCPAHPNEY